MSGNPLWMRIPDAVQKELDAIHTRLVEDFGEDVPRSRIMLAMMRFGIQTAGHNITPMEVYGVSAVGAASGPSRKRR